MIDTTDLSRRVNLLDLIGPDTRLRRVAATRGGEYAGPCPFCGGHDRLRVQPDQGRWWCRNCSDDEHWLDAIEYVRRRDRVDFVEACARLDLLDLTHAAPRDTRGTTRVPPLKEEIPPSPEWRHRAMVVVDRLEAILWSDRGVRARRWLNARGLNDETLKRWRVGYAPSRSRIAGLDVPHGIALPWFARGEIWQIKVRTPNGKPKYLAIAGGHPFLFGADTLDGCFAAVLVEGEFDSMLLHQEAGDLVGVATLGSCSAPLGAGALRRLLPISPVLVAYDLDADGQAGAARLATLSSRIQPITPPVGADITEFWQRGGRLRDWILFCLVRPRRA